MAQQLDDLTALDLRLALLGEKIGEGAFRNVYECRFDPNLVVKVEKDGTYENVMEWKIWNDVRWTEEVAGWFAPVVGLSPGGRVLIMRRTMPVSAGELEAALPKVPRFFGDLHARNWGRLDGEIVCHDYAISMLDDAANESRPWKLMRARWLDAD